MDQETFRRELESALSHLRDVAHLRALEMGAVLFPHLPRGQRGWELSRRLLETIDQWRPSPADHDAWRHRRYDLLTLRYVNGLTPDEAAEQLGFSRRHFYRQLQRALDEFAEMVRLQLPEPPQESDTALSQAEGASDDLDLLRREAGALLTNSPSCSLAQVWQAVRAVLADVLQQRGVHLDADIPHDLPEVAVSPAILRQFLMGLIGDLLGESIRALIIAAHSTTSAVRMTITAAAQSNTSAEALLARWQGAEERISAQLASLQGVSLQAAGGSSREVTCLVSLPAVRLPTVLIVDDNPEVCQLFRRYLASGGYQSLVANSGAEAIAAARCHDLCAVTLDLMMESEDGWDVLQALRHEPRTALLPVIVCTVLDHEELARLLGASAFLKKPVMRDALLQALRALIQPPPAGPSASG
ncbi:MAG: response regulator [Anaerolineae bacterium]